MRGRSRGVVLIIVLWLITILALVAVALAGYLSTEARLMRYRLARAQARAWAQAGVWLGLQRLARDTALTDERCDWLGDDWSYAGDDPQHPLTWRIRLPLDGDRTTPFSGALTMTITDEERRLSAQASETLRQRQEMTAEDTDIAREETSVYLDAESAVNINTVDARLLQIICTAAGWPRLAAQIAAYRWDPEQGTSVDDGHRFTRLTPDVETAGAPLDPGLKDALARMLAGPYGGWLGVQSHHFRIAVVATIERPAVRYRLEAVVRRSVSTTELRDPSAIAVDGASLHVLAWREG